MMRQKYFGHYQVISRKRLSSLGSIFFRFSTICIGALLTFADRATQLTLLQNDCCSNSGKRVDTFVFCCHALGLHLHCSY